MSDKRSLRVLVVDDDRDILDLLEYNLGKEGFKVKTLSESRNAIDVARDFFPDLIILDIMMPRPNGIELCRDLRCFEQFSDTYIFFLTAKSESYYQQAALDTGGDDYIEKVMGLRALTYKVNSVLKKRFVIRKSVREVKLGNLRISRRSNSVKINGDEIVLSKPEFELLFFFAQNPQKTITRESLLHNIWGSEIFLFDNSIDNCIQNLMGKLGWRLIQRINNDQYRLAGSVGG
jgi:two-component system alkaline phosphatase synthesis response regulator PhoP